LEITFFASSPALAPAAPRGAAGQGRFEAKLRWTFTGSKQMETTNISTTESQSPVTVNTKDQNMWAMLCHLSTFSVFIVPFGNIIGPLVIWLIKKDEFP
jgi:hypothetical protein